MFRWRRWWLCCLQGGHYWYLWDMDGSGTRLKESVRRRYPPRTGDGGVFCMDCRLAYRPCQCFFCEVRPLQERELRIEENNETTETIVALNWVVDFLSRRAANA